MRCSALLVAIVSFLSVAPLHGEDKLFSEVAMESVFQASPSLKPVASKNTSGSLDRVTSVDSLVRALTAAGMEARESNGRAALTFNHAGWKFPVSISVNIDQDRLDCRFTLIRIGDVKSVSTQKLLQLLASGDGLGTSFAYDSASKTIQVRASFSNRSITANELKSDLVQMARLAAKHADVWSSLTGSANSNSASSSSSASNSNATTNSPPMSNRTPRPESGAGVTSPPSRVSTSVASLVGRWSAYVANDEAFAIKISADSRFQLVHLKSGEPTLSKGNITRSGQQLKLIGDGDLTLDCTVAQSNANAFALAIKDANGNVAMKLNFKKAN
ncbi:MAG: hypothetical protein AAGG48_18055 [Planctomycetota bacterium]